MEELKAYFSHPMIKFGNMIEDNYRWVMSESGPDGIIIEGSRDSSVVTTHELAHMLVARDPLQAHWGLSDPMMNAPYAIKAGGPLLDHEIKVVSVQVALYSKFDLNRQELITLPRIIGCEGMDAAVLQAATVNIDQLWSITKAKLEKK